MATLRNTNDRYGAVAATIIANLALGILTLLLLVARLLWRAIDPPPPIKVGTLIERAVAHAGHLGLYTLTLVVALSGWLYTSSEHTRIDLLGGMELPALNVTPASAPATIAAADGDGAVDEGFVGDEDEGDEFWEEVHEPGSWALLALIALHAAAALMHRRRRDGTWERMFG